VNKKISKKDPKLKLNLKYFWKNWFKNCFFKIIGSKTEPIPINRFKNGTDSNKPVYETEQYLACDRRTDMKNNVIGYV